MTKDAAVETRGSQDFLAMDEESLSKALVGLVELWRSRGFDCLDACVRSLPASPFKKLTSLVIAGSMADEIAESGFEEFAKCSDRAGRRKALVITYGSLLLYDKDEAAEERLGKFRASPRPSAEIFRKVAELSRRNLNAGERLALRAKALAELDYGEAERRLEKLALSPAHPFSRGLEEFLASAELEAASPECLRGILAFGYFGKQHQDIGRECLLACRARGEGVGFGLFSLALLFAYGGDNLSHLDMRFALSLLGEASAAGCSIATEWRLRLLLSPASIDLPRMDISDAEWNDYEGLFQERLKVRREGSDSLDIKSMMVELKDARAHNRRDTRELYDPALAARLASERDPGQNVALLDVIVDGLWREGKFRDALKLIKRGLARGADQHLEDIIGLALPEALAKGEKRSQGPAPRSAHR